MIIGLSGYAKSGKDTVAKIIQDEDYKRYWEIRKFSGPLKKVASILTGIPEDLWDDQEFKQSYLEPEWGKVYHEPDLNVFKNEPMSGREFLQKLGTEAVRNNLHQMAWVNAAFAGYDGQDIVFTDCRFLNEANACKFRGGMVVRVVRPGIGPINNHPSETELDSYDFDYVISNNGTIDELKDKVIQMLKL